MKKFVFTVLACLLLMTTSANAAILKDVGGAYDLSSIHIIADNNARFEFNVIVVTFMNRDGSITQRDVANIREDYATGNIYRNGKPIGDYVFWGKTQREIYYKMKSAALSR